MLVPCFDMLEVMDMPADIHIYVMPAENRVNALLHILALTFTLCGVRIDRMMPYHNHPIFFRTAQLLFQPRQLLFRILLRYRGVVERVFVVLTYQRGGVDEDDALYLYGFCTGAAVVVRHHRYLADGGCLLAELLALADDAYRG